MSEKEKYNRLINALKKRAAEILPKGSRMSLYGSRARGDFRPDSDWDIHILIPGPERLPLSEKCRYAIALEDIGMEFNETVNARVYTFAGWLKRHFLPFYKNVETDSIPIFSN